MKLWEFFENLNELVYVADMDSYEILYMNKKAWEAYGFCCAEAAVGEKCYEVIQGNSAPCAFCNNHELVQGDFREWRYYNSVINKYFELKDTMIDDEGRRCRVEIAINIDDMKKQSELLFDYQRIEFLANEGIRLALQESSPDKSIDIILEYLGKTIGGKRAYIFERNELGGDDNTYEWVANGVTPEKENLQNLPPEVCATWYRNFSEDKNTIIENLEDIREDDPLLYETLKPQGINSLVVVPLYIDKKAVGFYGIDNPPKGLLGYASNMLSIVGYFIVSSLKRRDLLKHLEKLSYLDSLTGLGNRFAKDEYIDNVKCDESIGVVYCDITGLKRTNDTEGHEAGDRLILRACKELKKVFVGYGLFRIGGDEFLVLCPKIEKEMLEQKVEILREALLQNAVNMAIGMYWVENFESRRSIKELSLEAEKLMYEDKIAYYEAQKERKEG